MADPNMNQSGNPPPPAVDKKHPAVDPLVVELKEELKKVFSSIRNLEDKMYNLDKKTSLIEENLLLVKNKLNQESKVLHTNSIENEKQINLLKKSIMEMVSDMKNFARVEEVSTLRKYLEMWKPLNFVTRNELSEILEENKQ